MAKLTQDDEENDAKGGLVKRCIAPCDWNYRYWNKND